MTRLAATLVNDVRLQARNGFYYAAAFVAAFAMIGLIYVPADIRRLVLAPLVLTNLLIGTFYFVAGLVLLEKGEGTIEALTVTPLRSGEYVASKAATLAGLGVLENFAIVAVTHTGRFDPVLLVAGIVAGTIVYVFAGFVAAARYEGINEMLFPSVLWVTFLVLPLVQYGVDDPGLRLLFWVHPLQPSLVLLRAAFEPMATVAVVAASVVSVAWVVVLFVWSRRAFVRYVVRRGVAIR